MDGHWASALCLAGEEVSSNRVFPPTPLGPDIPCEPWGLEWQMCLGNVGFKSLSQIYLTFLILPRQTLLPNLPSQVPSSCKTFKIGDF